MFSLFAQSGGEAQDMGFLDRLVENPAGMTFAFLAVTAVSGILAGVATQYFKHRETMARLQERIALAERGIHPDSVAPRE